MSRWHYILSYSAIKTLAQKYSTTTKNILKRFGKPPVYINQDYGKLTIISLMTYAEFIGIVKSPKDTKKEPTYEYDFLNLRKMFWRTEFKLNAFCMVCGSQENIHMHHIKAIKKGTQNLTGFQKIKTPLNRKQIPLCAHHHKLVHDGKYDDISLQDLFDTRIATSDAFISFPKKREK